MGIRTTHALKSSFKHLSITSVLFASLGMVGGVQASDTYPAKPVRLLVGFPAGGPADSAARILAEGLQAELKQSFIVENRTGASGIIAAQAIAQSPPDGYNLLVATNSLTLNALTSPDAGYDPDADFVPIALLATQASAVIVHIGMPVSTLADLKQFAAKKKMSFASSGLGTSSHMIGTYLFNGLWHADMAAVPYRGAGPADVAVASGEPPVGFTTIGGAERMQQDKRVRILAIANDKRLPTLPDVPTMTELGYPNFSASWTALFAPAGTPAAVVDKINTVIGQLMARPAFREKFAQQSMDVPKPMTSSQALDYMKIENKNWQRVAQATGTAIK